MDANLIIDNLLERIKVLTKENVFLQAKLETIENDMKAQMEAKKDGGSNVE
jgi:hypothetical protein